MSTKRTLHEQIYQGVRDYPDAFIHVAVLAFSVGSLVTTAFIAMVVYA